MDLPNYFLADLPPGAHLTPAMIGEACHTLCRNREQYLAPRNTASMIEVLSNLAGDWLDPDYPFRKMALEHGPAATGFSRETLAAGLDAFFSQINPDHLHLLIVRELGHAQRLDAMVSGQGEHSGLAALATGPALLAHVAAGNLPAPTLMSLVLGLLTRSAQFVKCATGASLLPRLFAHSLYQAHPKLGACIEIAEWPGGSEGLESAVFEAADCVTVTGSDETIAQVRARVPARARFLGYGHRLSFGYIAHEMLTRHQAKTIAARAAADVTAWDQLGCLSPHLFFVEAGGSVPPDHFAELLAKALEEREATEPRGAIPVDVAAGIAAKRDFYKVRAAYSPDTLLWHSQGSTAWTVVYEADAAFQLSCLHRFIFVKPVRNIEEALQHAASVRGRVSTVGLAAPLGRSQDLATQLARWGATRICKLGAMQQPPLSWRHDGRPGLADLVTWTNWEQ